MRRATGVPATGYAPTPELVSSQKKRATMVCVANEK